MNEAFYRYHLAGVVAATAMIWISSAIGTSTPPVISPTSASLQGRPWREI
jgi:hypothetical protein